ncbi:MAG: SlyX family protein [Neisseria sp.]|nr:SlyX family protein [Neisseria sp.]
MDNDTRERLERLETRLAWQDETIDALERSVVSLQEALRLQQDALRYLYRKLNEQQSDDAQLPAHEKPPHY